jgi:hypothetical protein
MGSRFAPGCESEEGITGALQRRRVAGGLAPLYEYANYDGMNDMILMVCQVYTMETNSQKYVVRASVCLGIIMRKEGVVGKMRCLRSTEEVKERVQVGSAGGCVP